MAAKKGARWWTKSKAGPIPTSSIDIFRAGEEAYPEVSQTAQKKKKNKRKVRREKRKLAKAKSDRDDASAEDDEATEPAKASGANSKAGAQFGSNGNKATKQKT